MSVNARLMVLYSKVRHVAQLRRLKADSAKHAYLRNVVRGDLHRPWPYARRWLVERTLPPFKDLRSGRSLSQSPIAANVGRFNRVCIDSNRVRCALQAFKDRKERWAAYTWFRTNNFISRPCLKGGIYLHNVLALQKLTGRFATWLVFVHPN